MLRVAGAAEEARSDSSLRPQAGGSRSSSSEQCSYSQWSRRSAGSRRRHVQPPVWLRRPGSCRRPPTWTSQDTGVTCGPIAAARICGGHSFLPLHTGQPACRFGTAVVVSVVVGHTGSHAHFRNALRYTQAGSCTAGGCDRLLGGSPTVWRALESLSRLANPSGNARPLCVCVLCRYGLIVLVVEVIGVSSMLPYGLMLVRYTTTTGSW
jgi:hypothetical protein